MLAPRAVGWREEREELGSHCLSVSVGFPAPCFGFNVSGKLDYLGKIHFMCVWLWELEWGIWEPGLGHFQEWGSWSSSGQPVPRSADGISDRVCLGI